MNHLVSLARQCHQFEKFVSLPSSCGFVCTLDLKREGDVFPDTHQREKCQILENQRGRPLIGTNACHVPTPYKNASAARGLKTGDCPQQGRLTTARRAEKAEKLTTFDGQTGITYRDEIAELHPHIIELDVCTH